MTRTSAAQLGVGVIGVGGMGQRHAENLRHNIPGAKLVGVADADAARARQVATELNAEFVFETAEALVAHREIQAVVIASSSPSHAPLIELAAQAGKAIFCEKPLTLTLEEADRALAAVAVAGVPLQIGLMRRFDPAYVAAKKKIDSGEIGRPVIFKSLGRDRDCPGPAYVQAATRPALIFPESAIHDFDLARWLVGDEVSEVCAVGGALGNPELAAASQIDSSLVNLRFCGGAIGNVENFWGAGYGYDIRTEIVGTRGTLIIGGLNGSPLLELAADSADRHIVQHWLERFAEAYRLEMESFVQSVSTGCPPDVTGLEGRQALAIALAATESYVEARPVTLAL